VVWARPLVLMRRSRRRIRAVVVSLFPPHIMCTSSSFTLDPLPFRLARAATHHATQFPAMPTAQPVALKCTSRVAVLAPSDSCVVYHRLLLTRLHLVFQVLGASVAILHLVVDGVQEANEGHEDQQDVEQVTQKRVGRRRTEAKRRNERDKDLQLGELGETVVPVINERSVHHVHSGGTETNKETPDEL